MAKFDELTDNPEKVAELGMKAVEVVEENDFIEEAKIVAEEEIQHSNYRVISKVKVSGCSVKFYGTSNVRASGEQKMLDTNKTELEKYLSGSGAEE